MRRQKVQFVITGFGPFSGCRSNPTPQIIEELLVTIQQQQQQQPPTDDGRTTDKATVLVLKTHIFKTAAETVSCELYDLYQAALENPTDAITIMLHLGVNIGSRQFLLEQCAYNDATFRVPDELGYQPTNTKVDDSDEYALQRQTTLPLEQIICASSLPPPCQLSSDPGRYVCNYTYFKSLAYCEYLHTNSSQQYTTDRRMVHALFLHVPPLEAIPLKEQVDFILCLMETISETVTHQK